MPCRAHERLALQVLIATRSLAHDEHARLGIAHAEHGLRPPSGKRASMAGFDRSANLVERNMRFRHYTYTFGILIPNAQASS